MKLDRGFWVKDFLKSYFESTFRPDTAVVTLLVAVLFIFSGPFGTYAQMSLVERTIYWGPIVTIALAVGGLACEIELRCFQTYNKYRHGFLSSVGFAIIYSPVIFIITRAEIFGTVEESLPFWYVLASVFAFALILGLFIVSTNRYETKQEATQEQRPRLYARLPDVGTATISHITVSDHYVIVYMDDDTSHRVLMRFSDAVQEMDQTRGFCSHRSHWVAAEFVKAGKRTGNREFVELVCGKVVPVSKTYRENLVAAGFFQ